MTLLVDSGRERRSHDNLKSKSQGYPNNVSSKTSHLVRVPETVSELWENAKLNYLQTYIVSKYTHYALIVQFNFKHSKQAVLLNYLPCALHWSVGFCQDEL